MRQVISILLVEQGNDALKALHHTRVEATRTSQVPGNAEEEVVSFENTRNRDVSTVGVS